ncbi:hypothetical protein BBO99_00001429 [Phytophthora kernoviae]|uniref:C3H1-type domain-containing protein n=2 Tax=Phytophthora kernoviae TaxID=325452 RepID=A0A3R7G456_9STRA|nr:hypothetical protein G195_002153 [Phytophthora kernoviae 00238/432]KAG2530557.1 hypothetical protein JM16_000917 [Phytophthora kernoviae]KAG2531306.1 hypothetical protein JM18_001696 [Phytophthora kernoviae]RLN26156.1 hypothetical protein BBI17_001298 [Phytophthora kernoviae]RLN84300.1 hypothetical protein BBO99_00001429 [Phytophthora kernoviae]
MLEHSQFGGGLPVPQQTLHTQPQKAQVFAFQGMAPQQMPQFKQEEHHQTPKVAVNQAVPNVLQNMMSRSGTSKLTPSSVEASLLSLVDGELRVSSLSNLPTFLKILPRCKTEPEQTLALVVLRATSTASDAKLARGCAGTFEKSGGLRLARAITEARINEPIVKLRKNAREERVKRAAQDLLKFWRGNPATTTSSVDDTLSMPLPTIQSFKATSSATAAKECKRIRWADENGEELVKVKLIESWRDLVPYDPRHDDQSFRDAKLREHASERHAMLSQHHKVPPAVAASKSREWTTPAFIRLPEAVATRIASQANTEEMRTQSDRMRHVVEYEVLAGEVPTPSPKEWERVNEPHRGPALEVPLSDMAEGQTNNVPMPVAASAPMMAPQTSSAPRNGYPAGGYSQATSGFDQRVYNDRSEYNGHSEADAERKLREALGPLHENTVALLLDNQDAVPQVLDEVQRYGNRISDSRVHEIVEQHRRARFQPAPNAGLQQPPAYSPYGSQQQQYGDMGQYQQYPPPQQGAGVQYMPGKRKADTMGPPPQNGQQKKSRAGMHCRFFASPMGCKHGTNCRYAHVQAGPANGPELIYNNNGPMMGGQGADPVNRYGPVGMHGVVGHHMQGGR